jgi:hypothetical protein
VSERSRAKREELIERHRPPPGTEHRPCGSGQLYHLNTHRLLMTAVRRQLAAHGVDPVDIIDVQELVITRIVAWEVLAEAQRNGLWLRPQRLADGVR